MPYKSQYGNKKISGDITKLLQCYQEARFQRYLPKIEFRCGGTLRYNRQICKVIIVCPEGELREYPILYGIGYRPTYNAESQIQSCGRLKLTIQNGVMSSGTRYSWDTYAFAFYFPSEDYVMKCPKSVPSPFCIPDFELTKIEHDNHRCHQSFCPNWTYISKKRKQNDEDNNDNDDDDLGPTLKKSLFES